ncbi:MAG: hypothetical protein EON60_02115 [Alphaproteobacteria bacterium]|nr:MAG: hypothetical protein EON60_02115 [Alphaproteobacteria bacterium]
MAKKSPTPLKASPKPTGKQAGQPSKSPVKSAPKPLQQPEWLQDVSIEAPVPATQKFAPGQRQLEFSVGMRQIDESDHIRSELRARALVHAENVVLVVVEASYVNLASKADIRDDLPEYLYTQLKPHLEQLLSLTGHTPPLPESLQKVS